MTQTNDNTQDARSTGHPGGGSTNTKPAQAHTTTAGTATLAKPTATSIAQSSAQRALHAHSSNTEVHATRAQQQSYATTPAAAAAAATMAPYTTANGCNSNSTGSSGNDVHDNHRDSLSTAAETLQPKQPHGRSSSSNQEQEHAGQHEQHRPPTQQRNHEMRMQEQEHQATPGIANEARAIITNGTSSSQHAQHGALTNEPQRRASATHTPA